MLRKYFKVFSLTLQERIEYRMRVLIWILVDLLFLFVFPFIWIHIFRTGGGVGEFTEASIVTYYIGIAVFNALVLTHINFEMNEEIRDGQLTNYLIRPFSFTLRTYFRGVAMKVVLMALLLPFLGIAFFFFRQFIVLPDSLVSLGIVSLATFLASSLFFLLAICAGFSAFFLEDARAVSDMLFMIVSIFAGEFAPLSFFPPFFRAIAEALPFQYLAYFPLQIYLGHLEPSAIIRGLLMQCVWIILFSLLAGGLWHVGVRRYSAVGR